MLVVAGKGDYGDIMLARVDAGPDAGQHHQQQQQSLVVVKTLLSTAPHHQRALQHEAEMFSRATTTTSSYQPLTADCSHVVRLLGVCASLQPPLIVTEYCELVCTTTTRTATTTGTTTNDNSSIATITNSITL